MDRLGNQMHPMILMLFLNNNALIHTAGTIQSWFKEHEDELQRHSWSTQ
jgi:hypothetical protein